MNFVLPLLMFSVSAHRAVCPTGQAKSEAALIQVEREWVRASEHQDIAALGCLLADEFVEADFDGSVISRTTTLAGAAKPSNGHSELTDLHVHIYGETAVVRGIGVNSKDGKPTGRTRFTDIFVYRDGRWQCVAGHDSRFPNK